MRILSRGTLVPLAMALWPALPLAAQDALPEELFRIRAAALVEALASGELKRIEAFQPAPEGGAVPPEARRRAADAFRGMKRFFESRRGRFHRGVLEAFPLVAGLPADLRSIEVEQELEVRSGDEEQLVHGLAFTLRFERDEKRKCWIAANLQVEFESVVERRGYAPPERDLAPAALSAVLAGLFAARPIDELLSGAGGAYAETLLGSLSCEPMDEPVMGELVREARRALAEGDPQKLATVLGLPEEEHPRGDRARAAFAARLAGQPGWDAALSAAPRLRGIQPTARRLRMSSNSASGTARIEMEQRGNRWWLTDVTLERAGVAPLGLRSLLRDL